MTKFENVGVQNILSCHNREQVQAKFKYSCDCCCSKGRRADCDFCAIRTAHDNILAFFADEDDKSVNT